MDKQVLEILQTQENKEKSVYQSPHALKDMIQDDFINSSEILQTINEYGKNLVELFNSPTLVPYARQFPIPVRKCDFFHVSKHTLSQIPYLHSHNFYEFIYILCGECKQFLEFSHCPIYLKAHQCCLLQPGITHIVERCSQDDIILKFSISTGLYQEIIAPILLSCTGENVIVFDRHNAPIDWCIYMLLKEYNHKREFHETAVKNYLSLLFLELMRKPVETYPEIILELHSYFEEDPRQVTLHGFAARIGYSDDYAGRLIKNSTGKSFMEFVLELKIARAAKLLLETDYPIARIADLLGYANPSGFYKQFFRAYKLSPNEYRKTFL